MAADPPPQRRLQVRMAEATRMAGKPQYVIEKDYALGYLLAGISRVELLRQSLVFKGGTCLRKAYFPGYRFSEDLDFTARSPLSCEELLTALSEAAEQMRALLHPMGPFSIEVEEQQHREPHPRGQCVFRIRVQFPWMRTPACSLKVEVSAQEPLLAGSSDRQLIHEFPGEALTAAIPSYLLEEIAAEKLRALLQSRQHLEERGWLRNRPRDLYDLDHLWRQRDYQLDWRGVRDILSAKAPAYGLDYDGPDSFLDADVLTGIERDWQGQLADFVLDLPPFERCLESLRAILQAVFKADSRR